MTTIDEVYAFVMDNAAGDEVVMMVIQGGFAVPLVGPNIHKVESLRKVVQAGCNQTGKHARLVRFTTRQDCESILPEGTVVS